MVIHYVCFHIAFNMNIVFCFFLAILPNPTLLWHAFKCKISLHVLLCFNQFLLPFPLLPGQECFQSNLRNICYKNNSWPLQQFWKIIFNAMTFIKMLLYNHVLWHSFLFLLTPVSIKSSGKIFLFFFLFYFFRSLQEECGGTYSCHCTPYVNNNNNKTIISFYDGRKNQNWLKTVYYVNSSTYVHLYYYLIHIQDCLCQTQNTDCQYLYSRFRTHKKLFLRPHSRAIVHFLEAGKVTKAFMNLNFKKKRIQLTKVDTS